jgi:hypothetical protein
VPRLRKFVRPRSRAVTQVNRLGGHGLDGKHPAIALVLAGIRRTPCDDPPFTFSQRSPVDARHGAPPDWRRRSFPRRQRLSMGADESDYITRFTNPTQTDWVMRCTARKVLRVAEQEPVVLPPAKRSAMAEMLLNSSGRFE